MLFLRVVCACVLQLQVLPLAVEPVSHVSDCHSNHSTLLGTAGGQQHSHWYVCTLCICEHSVSYTCVGLASDSRICIVSMRTVEKQMHVLVFCVCSSQAEVCTDHLCCTMGRLSVHILESWQPFSYIECQTR